MIRAILVDDEQLALKFLEKQLLKMNSVEVVASYSSSTDMLKNMRDIPFNVAFLDIEMPGLNGLDLADLIMDWNKDILIVFVTAYRDYAVQAFELHSVDYLLKPIMLERLQKTTQRLKEQLDVRSKETAAAAEICTPPLQVNSFKEFTVYHQNELVKWKTAKVKELFAYFITHMHDSIHRDSLIDTLWPEVDYPRAKVQLHTTMSYLRKVLDSLGYPDAITFSHGSYVMSLDEYQSDSHQFEQFLHNSPSVTADNLEAYEETVRTYTGDYLEEAGYEWAGQKANALRQSYLHALQQLSDYFSQVNQPTKQHYYLQRLVDSDPYSEYATRQLMQCYIDIGNRFEALRVYQKLKDLLSEDLGIFPESETTDLYYTLLA